MNRKEREEKEIKEIIYRIKKSGQKEFTAQDVRKFFFLRKHLKENPKAIVVGDKIIDKPKVSKNDWERIGVYTSIVIRQLLDKGEIKLIREEDPSRGMIKKRVYGFGGENGDKNKKER